MEQWLEFAQKRAHSAAGKKILHIAIADRLQIDQHGRRVGELIELIETNLYAGAPRDRGEVNNRIGRTAERQENAQRVVHRLCIDDAVGGAVRADQFHRRSARGFRSASRSACTAGSLRCQAE